MNARLDLIFLCGLVLQTGCSGISDPAVRLAYCLEEAVKEDKSKASCKLDLPRGGVVVLHPDGDLTNDQLVAAGLTPDQAEAIRELRLNSFAAIYVLSNDPQALPSRTTYQRGFLRIPQILVLARTGNEPVHVNLAGPAGARHLASLR